MFVCILLRFSIAFKLMCNNIQYSNLLAVNGSVVVQESSSTRSLLYFSTCSRSKAKRESVPGTCTSFRLPVFVLITFFLCQ